MKQFKFTKKEVEDYLRNEVKWQDCKIKEILELYHNKKLREYYKPPESFQQIRSLIKISKDFDNIFSGESGILIFNRLMEILTKKLGYKFYADISNKVNKQKFKDDRDVFKYIKNKLKNREYRYKYNTIQFCNETKALLDQFHWKINKYLEDKKNYKYLDICYRDGRKTKEMAKKFKIDLGNTYGLEIKGEMGQYTGLDKDDDFPYSVIDYREKFPYPDNNFFFCSALMVLHYSKDIDFTLKEINRVMEKDGFLLIQEHDNFSIVDDMLAELGNTWRMTFNSVIKNTELNFNEVEQSIYYCWYEWDLILREYGFRYLTSSQIRLSVNEAVGSDRPFFFLCQKIKDL